MKKLLFYIAFQVNIELQSVTIVENIAKSFNSFINTFYVK